MKSKYYVIGGGILVVVAIIIFSLVNMSNAPQYAISKSAASKNQNALGIVSSSDSNSEFQEVRLYMKDFNYVTEPAILKKNIPVRMTVDLKTVTGCARDVVIRDFNVRKYVQQRDNVIEFTPTKTGTIAIACSMNMFHGTFQVADDANPAATSEITTSAATDNTVSASSCGMANGGGASCGCGMRSI